MGHSCWAFGPNRNTNYKLQEKVRKKLKGQRILQLIFCHISRTMKIRQIRQIMGLKGFVRDDNSLVVLFLVMHGWVANVGKEMRKGDKKEGAMNGRGIDFHNKQSANFFWLLL